MEEKKQEIIRGKMEEVSKVEEQRERRLKWIQLD